MMTFTLATMQAMHFCYGLGAFVSPLIAEPFLLNQDCSAFIDNTTDSDSQSFIHHHATRNHGNVSYLVDPLHEAQTETEVRFSFFIMGALQVRAGVGRCVQAWTGASVISDSAILALLLVYYTKTVLCRVQTLLRHHWCQIN